ncbi:MAG TPA: efflux RND transporter periplasmic adaptor subunit [Patescibacteria group bacterium]|nr:efflux RND transporter periplasmic adaptor subunit [Patescibacteria group bacterium]
MSKLFSRLFKDPKTRRIVISIFLAIILVAAYLFYNLNVNRVFIDNSLMQAPIISVSPDQPSKLTEIDVYEGETIKKGDQLAVTSTQTLRADTDGLIVMANTQIGSIVSSANPVVQLIQQPDLRVAGTLDENKGLNNVRVGQVVSFTVDALPGQTFWGYVDEIGPTAKQSQIAFSISTERPTQQFVIYARFNSAAYPQIKNGMSAKMTVYTGTK